MKNQIHRVKSSPLSITLIGMNLTIFVGIPALGAEESKGSTLPEQPGFATTFDPVLTTSVGYSDNIFSTRNSKVSDGILIVAPELTVEMKGSEVTATLFGEAEIGRYFTEHAEDYDDFKLGLSGDFRPSKQSRIFAGANYARDHEERQSPNDVNGLEATLYARAESYAGFSTRHKSWIARAGLTYEDLNFDDVQGEFGLLENDDRDRDHSALGIRVGRLVSQGKTVFVQGALGSQDYDMPVDQYGFNRDSTGGDLLVGYTYSGGRIAKGELAIGLLSQEFEDPTFQDIQALDISGSLSWYPSQGSLVSGTLSRSLVETTLPFSPVILESKGRASFRKEVDQRLSFSGSLSLSHDEFVDTPRVDYTAMASLGVRYQLSGLAFGGLTFSHAQRDSNNPHSDYDENSIFFYLGSLLNPSERDERFASEYSASSRQVTGYYGGIEGLFSNIHTELEGTRGGTGTLTSDFGDHGLGGGLFGGYGFQYGNWIMAIEVDGTANDTHWDHTNGPNGRVFSVRAAESYGLSNLLGHSTGGGMVYGRFGYRQGVFETSYVHSGNMTYQQDRLAGLRVGMGGEVNTSPRTFFRLDFSRTAFDDDDHNFGSGTDNFATSVNEVRLGFGYRPGAFKDARVGESSDGPFSQSKGFYSGFQLGSATLGSQISGPRNHGNVLNAAYADDGGLVRGFAGYKWSPEASNVFLSLELEVEAGNVSPQLERDPTGRDISIQREASIGLATRFGFQFEQGGTIFLRAGPVSTKFRTEYEVSGNTTIQESDLAGIRYGLGLELPVSEKWSIRFDATYSEYDDYQIEYETVNQDDFTNDETQFLIGFAYHY